MIGATVNGLQDLRAQLLSLPGKLRKRALRNALAAGARVVRNDARANAPVLRLRGALKAPFRKPGTVRDAISVRTSKAARKAGDVGVFVNAKPAKKGQRGAKSPNDPFYWRWLEFGWHPARWRRKGKGAVRSRSGSRVQGIKFLSNSARKLGEALAIFNTKILPAIAKLNNKGQTP